MTIIFGTNIIVDNFKILPTFPIRSYIYFLTHMHADHYQGMKSNWNYGQIFCTLTTKILLQNKFHNVQGINVLELNIPTLIYLNESKTLSVEVTFFDANHCPGAVMILFRGYIGTVFHTGDMRFTEKMIFQNPTLYPNSSNFNVNKEGLSIHIDELILDNTFCDPIFNFGSRQEALEEIKNVIDENRDCRILLALDNLGKEDILIHLAENYRTLIVVSHERYKNIKAINLRPELFTTNYSEGWIEIIKKHERVSRIYSKTEKCICIIATGWGNGRKIRTEDKKTYIISYSLHSNFLEMEQFVKSIKPSILTCLSRRNNENKKWEKIQEFSNYLITLQQYTQKGYQILKEKYTNEMSLSSEYRNLLDPIIQKQLNLELGITLTAKDNVMLNTFEFETKNRQIFQMKKRNNANKGLKITAPEENKFLNEQELNKIKESRLMTESLIISNQLKQMPLNDLINYCLLKKKEREDKQAQNKTELYKIFEKFGAPLDLFQNSELLELISNVLNNNI